MSPRLAAFSLLEVLVAFLLLTSALLVIIPHFTQPSDAISQRTSAALAADYARSRLARYGTITPLAQTNQSGAAHGWTWRDQVSEVRLPGADEAVFRIEIEVFNASGRTRLATVSGYR